ncbi:GFA family protein [Pendulispora brunnea]|uniref:GFA family protein n=1 Tax=Pendulispora brunnea TaxID=2905690 RepID=UPI00374E1AAD
MARLERKGGCLCGAVRYVLKGEPQATALCHCTHCQRQSGSAFSVNLFVKEDDYEQTGETKFYVDIGDSGQPSHRHFCANCGSPIMTQVLTIPGAVLVKAGTLDDMEGLRPQTEIYTDHAAKWLAPVAGAARFARSPV